MDILIWTYKLDRGQVEPGVVRKTGPIRQQGLVEEGEREDKR
jgi:hypothetical protein